MESEELGSNDHDVAVITNMGSISITGKYRSLVRQLPFFVFLNIEVVIWNSSHNQYSNHIDYIFDVSRIPY